MYNKKVFIIIWFLLFSLSFISCSLGTKDYNPKKDLDNNTLIENEVINELIPEDAIHPIQSDQNQSGIAIETENKSESNQEEYINYYYTRYGNTSGNITNGGYTVYDKDQKLHIISIKNNVYSFNPKNSEIKELFKLNEEKGYIKYLNTSENWLYYVETINQNIIRRENKNLDLVEVFYDGKVSYLEKYNIYLYFLTNYDEYTKLYYYKDTSENIEETKIDQVSNLTFFGTNAFYYKNLMDGTSRYSVRDISSSKNTILIRFDKGFIDIESVIAYDQFNIALIIANDKNSGFYLYEGSKMVHSITTKDGITDFSSINYDGNNFYFIGKQDDKKYLFSVDEESHDLLKYVEIPDDAEALNIINNWMYLRKKSTNEVYQLAPDEKKFKLLIE